MRFFTRREILTVVFTCLSFVFSVSAYSQLTAGALSFDGVNDKVRVVRNTISGNDLGDASFNISDVITIESWINPESGGGFNTQSVVSKSQRIPTSAQTGYIFPRTNDNWNNISFLLNINGQGWKQLTAPYPGKDSWHHVAATYDGFFMRIYIDGVLANQMAVTGSITVNTNPLTIGYQNGYTNEFYRGKIDDIRIWNRVLSACEIASNRSCDISNQDKLVAYYKFNQGLLGGVANLLENTLKDSGPIQNDGVLFDFGLLSTVSNWTDGINKTTCAPFVPPVVNVGSNAPSILVGGTLQLTASGGTSYAWTGPNGFTSTDQNPVITNITTAAAGLYTVTVTNAAGCSVPASISIQVSNPARALNFDGDNDFVSIPHNNSLNPTSGLTVEAWIYPTNDLSPTQSVIGKSSDQVKGYIFPRTDDGWKSFSFYVHLDGIGWSIISASYPNVNQWHHVAATYDGFVMKIYLDGDLKASKNVVGTISSNLNPITIGMQPGFINEYFKGNVDEVRIWNRPLTECEIDNNMNCQLNPSIQTGLAAYYRFNNGLVGVNNSGINSAADLSGNNNNGTLNNFALNGTSSNWTEGTISETICSAFAPINAQANVNGPVIEVGSTIQLQASGGTSYSWTGPNNFTSNQQNPTIPNAQTNNSGSYTVTVGNNGCNALASAQITVAYKAGSLDFDGINDLVTVQANNSLNITEKITLESWIYPTDGTRQIQDVMCKSTASTNTGYIFPRTDDGWKTVSFLLHLNGQWKVLTTSFPGLNRWSHMAATYDGYYMRIYINGVLAASEEVSGQITSNGNNLVLGQQPGFVEYFTGKIEEAKLWNRALNQCEIINNMNCELQPQQTGLVAYFKFNQGFADVNNAGLTTLIDASPNNNNGILSNFALNGTTSNWSEFKVNGTCSTYAEPPVTAEANASVFGIGSTIRLFANGGTAYNWVGPNNFSANIPDPFITNAQSVNSGTYTVAVPFVNCTIYRSVRLTVTPLPAIQANGPTVICPSSVVKLSMSVTGTAYQWYRNGEMIPSADSAVHSASQSGSYHVAVTVNGQVQVSAPIEVSVVDVLAPVPDISSLPVLNVNAPFTITSRPTATDNCAGTVLATTSNPLTYSQAGTYTITWVYNDGNDNEVTQQQQIIVTGSVDIVPPVITAPANIVKSNDLNICGAVATFTATATDNQSTPVITYSHASGTVFPVGTTLVTITAKDAAGNTATATFTVKVNDTQVPVLSIPADIDATSGTGINVGNATATDNCGTPVITSTPIPAIFPIGVTNIVWTATDASGNTTSLTQKVTVRDVQLPTIVAPPTVTTVTNNNQAFATGVNLGTATASDNSGSVTVTNNAPAQYLIGTTTITWTATDASGNTATATQLVVVQDKQAPSLSGPADKVVNTNPGANFATAVNLGNPTVTDNSGQSVTVSNNAPVQYQLGVNNVTWTATDAYGNSSTGIQKVTVIDAEAPVITGVSNIIVNAAQGTNTATVTSLGTPVATDNVQVVSFTNNATGTVYPIGTTTITWTAKDAAGNTTTGTQLVIVQDATAPTLVGLPANVNASCSTIPSVANVTATDNFDANVSVQFAQTSTKGTNPAQANFYNYTITRTWTATDAAGNTTSASRTVTVADTEAPVFGSLSNIVTNNAAGTCGATVNYTATATDGCGSPVTYTYSKASGTVFSVGVTTVTVTATDVVGNTATRNFTVTVNDNQAPVFTSVPANITVAAPSNSCAATVNYGAAVASDACSAVTLNYSKASGTQFATGTTTVTVTATDASGNTNTASFTVTVVDTQAPQLTLPANITTNVSANTCGANVSYFATASDNCGGTVNLSYSKVSGTEFPIGTTTVTVTARDAAGNTSSGSFTVTVLDNQAPSITAPANITVAQGSAINLGTPVASDNCGTPVISNNAPTSYPVGVTTITWTATDAAGNRNTATQTVTVTAIPTTCSSSITVVPENTIYTGGVPSNIYLGYGPQKVTLRTNVAGGTSYTYTWTAVSGNGSLSSTTSSQPVFTPTTAGNYTFRVTVRTQSGCVSTSTVTICVKDIRVKDQDDDKCDHKSHSSKDCKHGKHNHGKCDHKSHNKDKCKDKYDDGDDDNDECDHKSHDTKNCKHKGHRHNNCDHKSHNSSSCKNKYNDRDDDDHDDDHDENYKVYLCHAPNGNTGNAQTLKISVNAVAAHLSNHPGDRLGSCADQGCAVTPPVPTCTSSITAVPENNTYTGGVPTNLYIGYGPQKVTLQVSASGSSNYSYSWRALTGGGSLSNTTSAQPVFTATAEGYYTFEVKVTGQSGCTSTSQVGICVKDIRVEEDCTDWGWLSWLYYYYYGYSNNDPKVYITRRNGNSNNYSVLEVKTSDVAAHLQRYPNDILGKGLTGCVSNSLANTGPLSNIATITEETVAVKSTAKTAQAEITDDLAVTVMGNPSRSMFTVKIQSKHTQPVQIRVFDMYGRAVESKANQHANSTVQFGHNLGNGTYYAEFTQGSRRKVVQLIKVK